MQPIKLNKQSIIFITLSLLLLIELFILLPWGIGRISKMGNKAKMLKQKIESTKAGWEKKEEYSKKITNLKEIINADKEKIVEPGQESRLISFISKNSQKYNIKIKAITPLDSLPTANDNFESIPFRIEAEGNFHDLGNFFEFLQQNNYFFELKELTLVGYRPNKINMLLCGLRKKEE